MSSQSALSLRKEEAKEEEGIHDTKNYSSPPLMNHRNNIMVPLHHHQRHIHALDEETRRNLRGGAAIYGLAATVKELVDNALDAGSTTINVRLHNQGKDFLEVTDDGTGIPASSRPFVALPYTTSKLTSVQELQQEAANGAPMTLGFRGEALHAIVNASAKFALCTRCADEPLASMAYYARDGTRLDATMHARPRKRGTTVAVWGLFTHFPVRRQDLENRAVQHRMETHRLLEHYCIFAVGTAISLFDVKTHPVTGAPFETCVVGTRPTDVTLDQTLSSTLGPVVQATLTSFTLDLGEVVAKHAPDLAPHAKHRPWKVEGRVSRAGMAIQGRKHGRQFFCVNGRPMELVTMGRALTDVWKSLHNNNTGTGGAGAASKSAGGRNTQQQQQRPPKHPYLVLEFTLPRILADVNLDADKRSLLLTGQDDFRDALVQALQAFWSAQLPTGTHGGNGGAARFVAGGAQGRPTQSLQQQQLPCDLLNIDEYNYDLDDEDEALEDEPFEHTRRLAFSHTTEKATLQHENDKRRKSTAEDDRMVREVARRNAQQQEDTAGVIGKKTRTVSVGFAQRESKVQPEYEEEEEAAPVPPPRRQRFMRRGTMKAPLLYTEDNENTMESTTPVSASSLSSSFRRTATDHASSLGPPAVTPLTALSQSPAVSSPVTATAAATEMQVGADNEQRLWQSAQAAFQEKSGAGLEEEIQQVQALSVQEAGEATRTPPPALLPRVTTTASTATMPQQQQQEDRSASPLREEPAAAATRRTPQPAGFGFERFGFRAIPTKADVSNRRPRSREAVQEMEEDEPSRKAARRSTTTSPVAAAETTQEPSQTATTRSSRSIHATLPVLEAPRHTPDDATMAEATASTAPTAADNEDSYSPRSTLDRTRNSSDSEIVWESFKSTDTVIAAAHHERLKLAERKRKLQESSRSAASSASASGNDKDGVLQVPAGDGDLVAVDDVEDRKPAAREVRERKMRTVSIGKEDFPSMTVVGQFNVGFILCQTKDNNLWIMDQHACDEKYNFEKLCNETRIHEQSLLTPLPLELSPIEETCVLENLDIFEKNGFRFDYDETKAPRHRLALTALPYSGAPDGSKAVQFGPQDVSVLCSILGADPSGSSYDAFETSGTGTDGGGLYGNNAVRRYASGASGTNGDSADKIIARLPKAIAMFASRACRRSIMIGKALSEVEMKRVIDNLSQVKHPWDCPHGRPTMQHVSAIGAILREDQRAASNHVAGPTVTVLSQDD